MTDWTKLSFKVQPTKSIIISRFCDGLWSEPVVTSDFNFSLDVFAGVFHYSNSCFEGLKAFRGKDGKVRIFRPDENAARMARSGRYLEMPTPSEDLFIKMCVMCVEENIDYLPPYGYNGSMYIRPVLIGVNPQLNVESSSESIFAVMCNPVGTYTGSASLTSIPAVISRDFDRVATNGTGSYKLGANYAPSFHPYKIAKSQGYKELLFLDCASHSKIDEFGTSNFMAIKGDSYITPLSGSVLPSITNKSLQQIASDFGMKVERREVFVEELSEFEEVGACGTAVVITPICSIDDKPLLEGPEVSRHYEFCAQGQVGPTSKKLYEHLRGIQDGLVEDIHDWCMVL